RLRAPSHWYSGSLKALTSNQHFAFSAKAPGHSKISRNPGIPAKRDKFMCQVFGFLIPIDRCVDDQNYTLSDKVISEAWQEKSRIFYSIMP
ncbi:hypothetical protein, partial [Bartonella sp. AC10YNML]|uniref:hypothetical protein n=1 Tax=Bartonella sp. AC10YNML TaxID=3243444 RepID=UPI0035CEBB1E